MDEPSHWVTFLNDIFNPTFGFVHICPKVGLKQPSIFRVYWFSTTTLLHVTFKIAK